MNILTSDDLQLFSQELQQHMSPFGMQIFKELTHCIFRKKEKITIKWLSMRN